MTKNANNHKTVMVMLDRPREVRFGNKGLKMLQEMTGKGIDDIMPDNNISYQEVEVYMYCGLQSDAIKHKETLTLEMMDDLLDQAPVYGEILVALHRALYAAYGLTQEDVAKASQAIAEARESAPAQADAVEEEGPGEIEADPNE
jgi:hypothetical protein